MDLPILKHLDILIGLAVVMLMASTVVVAITQFIMSGRRARSSYLRETLTNLVSQIAPKLDAKSAHYVAERLLRHPLVGRNGWLSRLRNDSTSGLPFPKVARGEVILRHEIIISLLEWAAREGPLALQDRELSLDRSRPTSRFQKLLGLLKKFFDSNRERLASLIRPKATPATPVSSTIPEAAGRLRQLTESLREALRDAGVADPAAALRDLRRNMVELESANPDQPAQAWRTQAVVKANLGDLTGKVFASYDNSMQRVTEFFSLDAKVVASLIALSLCFAIQLDSVGLLKRLAGDEKLRAALVAQAETAKKAYELATAAGSEVGRDEAVEVIRKSVDSLRDPRVAAIPDYLLWENVAQLKVKDAVLGGLDRLELSVDTRKYEVTIPANCARLFPECPAAQIRQKLPPIEVYSDETSLTLVARTTDVSSIRLYKLDGAPSPSMGVLSRSKDWIGLCHRAPGIALSWILLSLGAPFWYDLLKRLLGFRSILQSKDDAEREARDTKQEATSPITTPTTGASGAALPLQGQPEGVVLKRPASLRMQPNASASFSRELPEEHLVNVEGFVEVEAAPGGEGVNRKWYQTVQGDFLWDGDVKPVPAEGN